MSLTARSNELEITPASSLNMHLARAGWCSQGFPTSSSSGKPALVWKSLPWPTDVAALAIGGIGLNDAGAFVVPDPSGAGTSEDQSGVAAVSGFRSRNAPWNLNQTQCRLADLRLTVDPMGNRLPELGVQVHASPGLRRPLHT